MTDKQRLVEKLIKEDKINIEEALILLKEEEIIYYVPHYRNYLTNGGQPNPYHRGDPYVITCKTT